jgi:hypothetical protein
MPQLDKIRRTLTITKCHGQIVKDGEFFDFYAELNGAYTPERATARLRKDYEDYTILITSVEQKRLTCEMPIDEFIIHSTIVKDGKEPNND